MFHTKLSLRNYSFHSQIHSVLEYFSTFRLGTQKLSFSKLYRKLFAWLTTTTSPVVCFSHVCCQHKSFLLVLSQMLLFTSVSTKPFCISSKKQKNTVYSDTWYWWVHIHMSECLQIEPILTQSMKTLEFSSSYIAPQSLQYSVHYTKRIWNVPWGIYIIQNMITLLCTGYHFFFFLCRKIRTQKSCLCILSQKFIERRVGNQTCFCEEFFIMKNSDWQQLETSSSEEDSFKLMRTHFPCQFYHFI